VARFGVRDEPAPAVEDLVALDAEIRARYAQGAIA
jgi:hypothetical protein